MKACPLRFGCELNECIGELCAWFCRSLGNCGVNILAILAMCMATKIAPKQLDIFLDVVEEIR